MRFWTREVAGWGLIVVGLGFFLRSYVLCSGNPHLYVEAMITTVIGIFVFRGGINLLKTAVAARVCEQAQDRLYPAPVPPVRAPMAQRLPGAPTQNRPIV